MNRAQTHSFGPFHLDLAAGRLRCGDEVIRLRPKTWAVLCHLVENAGRLVTKDELLAKVWNGNLISDTVTNISVAELRRALDDRRDSPRYIETVHGRGFRFVASVEPAAEMPGSVSGLARLAGGSTARHPSTTLIGRDAELAEVRAFFSEPAPQARVMLLAGEAGIGKTSLLHESLLELAQGSSRLPIGRGQCPPHFGQGYSFLPIIGALEDLCDSHADVIPRLRAHAPSWFVHMPFSSSRASGDGSGGGHGDLKLDELVAFAQGLGPLVLTFEDLHWADHATLDFIQVVAGHPGLRGCRVLGTYRPAEAIAARHPIIRARREMQRYRRVRELALGGLDTNAIAAFVSARFGDATCPHWLANDLETRSAGNPLFLGVMLDHLMSAGALEAGKDGEVNGTERYAALSNEIPETLRDLVQQRWAEHDERDRRLLGALSVVGLGGDAAAAAAALNEPAAEVDAACAELARTSIFLDRCGESVWPDGSVSSRYVFCHPLYQRVVYDDLPPALRSEAHRRVATALVEAFGDLTFEIAALVADHFDRGKVAAKAVDYHLLAARYASERYASSDAISHLHRALALQRATGDTGQEARILTQLARTLPAVEGFTGADFPALFARARGLHAGNDDAVEGAVALAWLAVANLMQGKARAAESLAQELTQICVQPDGTATPLLAGLISAVVLYHQGDIGGAAAQLDIETNEPSEPPGIGPIDLRVARGGLSAVVFWQAGRPDAARAAATRAVALADTETHPFNLLLGLQGDTVVELWCGNLDAAAAAAQRLRTSALEQGVQEVKAMSLMVEGYVQAESGCDEEAIESIEASLEALHALGTVMSHVFVLALGAEALIRLRRLEHARTLLEEGRRKIADGDARYYEPEIERLQGEIHLLAGEPSAGEQAEKCFRDAHRIAEQQGSGSLVLRSALSLARLWRARGDAGDANRIVRAALRAISGGEQTRDLEIARTFLAATTTLRSPG